VTGSAFGEIAKHGVMLAGALSTTGWGRLVLVVIGGYTTVMGASTWWNGSDYAWVAVLIGLSLLALAAFGMWKARREHAEQGGSRGGVAGLVGLVLTLLAGALLLLRHRKRSRGSTTARTAAAQASPVPLPPTSAQELEPISPVEAGRRGLRGLVAALPGIAWGTLRGLIGGSFLLGAVGLGLGLAAAASARWWLDLPGWLVWTNLIVTPFVLFVAGAYVGTIRGFLAALARALVERGVVPELYALVRPALARVASGITRHTDPLTRREAVGRIEAHVRQAMQSAEAAPPSGVLERFERSLAMRTQTWLAVASTVSASDDSDRAAALAQLELRGVEGVESNLAGTISAAYHMQALIALSIAAVILSVPWIVFAIVD
jgi:hypothetical protein